MNKNFWKAALNRALRTVAQTLVGSIPTGVIVTAEMVKGLNINALWAVLAWLVTGLLAGLASILTSLGWGVPEANAPKVETRKIYLDEYDEDGSPVVDKPCEACDLSQYVDDDAENGGDAE